MQIDETRVAVRERSLFDLLDLSLRVWSEEWRKLTILSLTVVAPLLALNAWLLGHLIHYDASALALSRYMWLMLLLVYLESPLVVVPLTAYLGRRMFNLDSRLRTVWRDVFASLGRTFWCVGVVRGVLAGLFVAYFLRYEEISWPDFALPLLAGYVHLLRALRPYIVEIVVLERAPLRSRHAAERSVGSRSAQLHNPNLGDLIGQQIVANLVALGMAWVVIFTIWYAWGMLRHDMNWDWVMKWLFVPLAMWVTVVLMAVFRYFSYLNLRIRSEGWEVELAVRAAAARYQERRS